MGVLNLSHSYYGKPALNYVLHGLPHFKDIYVTKRVLMASAINCTVKGVYQQMGAVWKRYKRNPFNHHKKRQIQRMIQSFDPQQLSYKDPNAIKIANRIGNMTAQILYPHNQTIIVTQADNKKHIIHNHILTNMIDPATGRSLTRRETNFEHARFVSDKVIEEYGFNPSAHKNITKTSNGRIIRGLVHKTHAEINLTKHGKYSWVADLRKRLHLSFFNATGWSDFIKSAKSKGVTVNVFKKRRVNGKRQFRKHISYKFHDKNGKLRRIRDKKLGGLYSPVFLQNNFFTLNQKNHEKAVKSKLRKQKHDRNTKLKKTKHRKAKAKHFSPKNPVNIALNKHKSVSHDNNTHKSLTVTTMERLGKPVFQQDFGAELDLVHYSIFHRMPSESSRNYDKKIKKSHGMSRHANGIIKDFSQKLSRISDIFINEIMTARLKAEEWLAIHKIKFEPWRKAIKPKVDTKVHHIKPSPRFSVADHNKSRTKKSKKPTPTKIGGLTSDQVLKISKKYKKPTPTKVSGLTSDQVLKISKKLNKKLDRLHLERCPYWQGFINYYRHKYPSDVPNPTDKDYLEPLHRYAITQDQNKYAARRNNNLAGFKFNKSERKVNIEVGADPNDPDNYTRPWYAKGLDNDPDKSPYK